MLLLSKILINLWENVWEETMPHSSIFLQLYHCSNSNQIMYSPITEYHINIIWENCEHGTLFEGLISLSKLVWWSGLEFRFTFLGSFHFIQKQVWCVHGTRCCSIVLNGNNRAVDMKENKMRLTQNGSGHFMQYCSSPYGSTLRQDSQYLRVYTFDKTKE